MQLVGWCLGGIMALLSVAAAPGRAALPVRSITTIASPWDVRQAPIVAPLRPLVNLTGGPLGTLVYHLLGGAPAPLVKRVYQLAGVDKYLKAARRTTWPLLDEFLAATSSSDDGARRGRRLPAAA